MQHEAFTARMIASTSPTRWPSCEDGEMDEAAVRRESGVDYGAGKLLDIYVPEASRGRTAVLLWHGSGANERGVLEPLARRIALAGVGVIVPDWSTDDGANGSHDLASSLLFARNQQTEFMLIDRIVLAGWSRGASAGLDVVRHPEVVAGWRPAAFVGISGGFDGSPFYRNAPRGFLVDPSVPILLIHGSSDEVVPAERSRITFDHLRSEGWNVKLREVDTDHAGAIGTTYDPARHCCVPTTDPLRLGVLATVARWIGELALAGREVTDTSPR
jgi:dienelactone hydrolase